MKKYGLISIIITLVICIFSSAFILYDNEQKKSDDYIKWVDCRVPYEVIKKAYEYEVIYHKNEYIEFDFVKSLAYLATKNGNKFSVKRDIRELDELLDKIKKGKRIDEIYGKNKYYKYYAQAYDAIFREFIGDYADHDSNEIKYGLKNYHPFAKGYWFSHFNDFGTSRSFGFKRKHLGHDLMGSIGTPIVAIEGGTIAELGWNKYGGWRIGVRSFDKKRSYYYAHLRKDKPYIEGLKKGDKVQAGQVIGYLGVTGYSTKENTNMGTKPHLHLGMQLIFNEEQVQGPKEIWIDMYQVCKFLSHNRADIVKDGNDFKSVGLKKSLS